MIGGRGIRTILPRRRKADGGAPVPARSLWVFKSNGTVSATLRWARLTHALCTPETLIMLMATTLAASFLSFDGPQLAIPWWVGLAAALVGYAMAGVLLLTTFTDPESIRDSCATALEDHFNLRAISDGVLRDQMSQAVAHRARMAAYQARLRKGRPAEPIAFAAIDEWLTGMGRLALRLEDLQSEFRLQSESRPMLLLRLHALAERIDTVSDKRTTDQLRETMAGRRQQLRAIEELESLFERGLLRLEHAVAALGTVHARLTTLVMRGEEQADTAALTHDINGEIQEIELFLTALDRVQDAGRAAI